MKRFNRLPSAEKRRWGEFLAGLGTILLVALGQGAFLILMVAYLEYRQVPVVENGMIKGFLSLVEGVACLGMGFLYRGRHTRTIIIASVLLMAVGPFLFAFQPLGPVAWIATGINGIGIGVLVLIPYVATLARRPSSISLGLAVGLFTACIAAGNALGEIISGILTDGFGFGASFSFSGVMMVLVIAAALLLGKDPAPAGEPGGEGVAYLAEKVAEPGKSWVWMMAVGAGFTLSSVNVVFDTLFPIYGLRAGLSFSVIGVLMGLKMLLAALVRPFSGAIMSRLDGMRLNNWSLTGLAGASMLTPLAGLGAGLYALVSVMGLTFGACRVTSAALTLYGQNDPRLTSQRSGIYNTAMSIGQVLGPWLSGWMAGAASVSVTLIVLPGVFMLLYALFLYIMPRLNNSEGLIRPFRMV